MMNRVKLLILSIFCMVALFSTASVQAAPHNLLAKKTKNTNQTDTNTTPAANDNQNQATTTPAEPAQNTNATGGGAGANLGGNCTNGFFFLPSIYEFIDGFNSDCSPQIDFPFDIVKIGMAVLDILLRLIGMVAIVGIILGGVGYMTAGGSFEKTANAKSHLYNALVGLAIASIAAALVSFLGNSLT